MGLPVLLLLCLGPLHLDGVLEGRHPREVLALADSDLENGLLRLELAQLVLERDQGVLTLVDLTDQGRVDPHGPLSKKIAHNGDRRL